ncbi:MAG: carboxypeptidase-like regulatory domain-containing protein [Nostoc sp. DedQUE08]|uniref:carboxypeptidase-like regulatory domain-containing protein n=1 Tax=unclassified Nostoc TaxID=2593658 RepID=UPI002AD24658|nr:MULTISPECIES: carboxypeptidase-like regulatory domain-containing protein [unclassified Nostoc]MDZ8067968.1 carboxypeptidase-like regulatory domain-containing protein [Nostoc sp. DedQUE08]MDZ8095593.1 carboxypeptidase-like regulatory domain-containing protein [Nostoc sp. DedQUE05]
MNTDIRYNPSFSLSTAFISDRLSSRFNLDWRVLPQFILFTSTDTQAIAGARVEAIQPDRGTRRFSATNGAGVYYLEGLPQGKYTLQINGKSFGSLTLEESSEAFQELNLQQSAIP